MSMPRRGLFAVVIASAALSVAACSATQFEAFNSSFKEIKVASKVVANSTMPAAAMATNMAVVELMNGLTSNASGKSGIIAVGGGNLVSANGGGVIAAGAANYSLLGNGAGKTETTLRDDGSGTLKAVKADGKVLIDATYRFKKEDKDGKLIYTIQDFKGLVSGFQIDVHGSFTYTGAFGGESARMEASVKGKMSLPPNQKTGKPASLALDLKELSFDAPVPLSGTIEKLGSLKLVDGGNGNVLTATAGLNDGAVEAKGSLKKANGELILTVTMDENGLRTETAASKK